MNSEDYSEAMSAASDDPGAAAAGTSASGAAGIGLNRNRTAGILIASGAPQSPAC